MDASDYYNPQAFAYVPSSSFARPYAPSPLPGPTDGLGQTAHMLTQIANIATGGKISQASYGYGFQGNAYYNSRQRAWVRQQNEMLQQSAKADTEAAVAAMRYSHQALGRKWTPADEIKAQQTAATMTPMLMSFMLSSDQGAQMLDRVSGGRNRTVFARGMHQANMYAYDPTTGAAGYSAQNSLKLAAMLGDQFFGDPKNGLSKTRGLSAFEVSNLYGEMLMRGQISTARFDRKLKSDLSGFTDDSLSPDEREKQDMQRLKQQADRIKKSLESRFEAISALKELFGSRGEPNAPIGKLIDALEEFSGGTQQYADSARLKTIVRRLDYYSAASGVSLQDTQNMLRQTQQKLVAAGVNPALSEAIVSERLNSRIAFNRSGAMDHAAWGLHNVDQLASMYEDTVIGGSASEAANIMGAMVRMQEAGQTLDTTTPEGRRVKAVLDEIQSGNIGNATVEFGNRGKVAAEADIAKAFNVSALTAREMLDNRMLNQEPVSRFAIGAGIAEVARPAEIRKNISKQVQDSIAAQLSQEYGGTKSSQEIQAMAEQATKALLDRWDQVGAEGTNQAGPRGQTNIDALRGVKEFNGLTDDQLRTMGEFAYNATDRELRNLYPNSGGAANYYTMFSDRAREDRARSRAQQQASVAIADASGSLIDDPITRVADHVIREGYTQGGEMKLLRKALGLGNNAEMEAGAKAILDDIVKQRSGLVSEAEDWMKNNPGKKLPDHLRKKIEAYTVRAKQASEEFEFYKSKMSQDAQDQIDNVVSNFVQDTAAQMSGAPQPTTINLTTQQLILRGAVEDITIGKDMQGKASGSARTARSAGDLPVEPPATKRSN